MNIINYLRNDLKRAIMSRNFGLSCIGVTGTMFFSIYRMTTVTSVYRAYSDASYFIPYIIVMTFCALVYAGSFVEDYENRYIYLLILRGNIKRYVISKICSICFAAVLALVIGTLCFVLIIHIKVPWMIEADLVYDDALLVVLGKYKNSVLYFVIHSVYMGNLAVILSLVAAYISLFWKNKILVLSIPFIIYYLSVYSTARIFPEMPQFNTSFTFNPIYNVWGNYTLSLVLPFIFSAIIVFVIGVSMYKKIRRECNG